MSEFAVEQQMSATVTSGSADAGGLRVVVDGATVDSPAKALNGAPYALNDRVTVTVRNPQPPLVNGKES